MANALFRCTMVFDAPGHGWTETHTLSQASDSVGLALSTTLALAQKRAPLLGTGAQVTYIRAAILYNTLGVRIKGPVGLQKVSLKPTWGTPGQPLDEPDAALMVRAWNVANGVHKQFYLRGIPDVVDAEFGTYEPANLPGYSDLVTAYFNLLSGAVPVWGWEGVSKSADFALVGYTSDPATGAVVVTLAGAPFLGASTDPVQVRFQGINQSNSKLNGLHVVRPTSNTTCVLTKPLALIEYQGLGKMTLYNNQFNHYSDMITRDIHTRRVGAPLLESRGRGRRAATT